MSRRVDFAIAIVVTIFGILVILATQQIRAASVPDPLGPRGIPTGIGVGLVLLGAGLSIRRLRGLAEGGLVPPEGTEDDEGPEVRPGSAKRAMSIWGASVVYVLTLPALGYLIGTPLFMVVVLTLMSVPSPVARVGVPVGFTIGTFVVFNYLLNVHLPLGVLRDLMRSLGLA